MLVRAIGVAVSAGSIVLAGLAWGEEPPELSHELGQGWSYGGALELDSIAEREFDLGPGESDVVTVEPRLELGLSYAPEVGPRFYAETRLSRGIFLEGGNSDSDSRTQAELRQAYFSIDGPRPGLSFRVGRQRFEDERGWWYDEDLDAAQLRYQAGRAGFELSVGRNPSVGGDVLDRDRARRGDNLMAVSRFAPDESMELSAYLIAQDNRSEPSERPLFFGLRSIGSIGTGLQYWIDAALVRGTDDGTDIRAHGFDAGINYRLEAPMQPSLLLGLAFGSGDDDPLDGEDSEFRQTGLQSSFFDYGEVLAPELSNLWIATAGVELRPASDTSFRITYHLYRQHRAAATLRDALIERDPDGSSRDLGQALDIVATYEGYEDLYLDLVVGVFDPGTAFGSDADRAWFAQLLLTYEFW